MCLTYNTHTYRHQIQAQVISTLLFLTDSHQLSSLQGASLQTYKLPRLWVYSTAQQRHHRARTTRVHHLFLFFYLHNVQLRTAIFEPCFERLQYK